MKNILSNLLHRQTRQCQTNPCKMCYETVDTMLHFVMRMLPSNDFKDGLMLSVFFLSKNKYRPCYDNYTCYLDSIVKRLSRNPSYMYIDIFCYIFIITKMIAQMYNYKWIDCDYLLSNTHSHVKYMPYTLLLLKV